jgi:hypothetical protein
VVSIALRHEEVVEEVVSITQLQLLLLLPMVTGLELVNDFGQGAVTVYESVYVRRTHTPHSDN